MELSSEYAVGNIFHGYRCNKLTHRNPRVFYISVHVMLSCDLYSDVIRVDSCDLRTPDTYIRSHIK
jgi:hypothetical protein